MPLQISKDQLKRKRQLCEEVIKVLNKITPGRDAERGLMMYQYSLTLSHMLEKNMVSSFDMKITYLTAALKYLKEAMAIFNDSPKGSNCKNLAEEIERTGSIAKMESMLMMMRISSGIKNK
jgi:hypothetical protein